MERRFTALRIIGTIFKILAWISLLAGVLAAILALVAGFVMQGQDLLLGLDIGGPLAAVASFIVILIVAIFYFLLLYAAGEAIYMFLAIEENTRRTAYITQQQYMSYQSTYPPAPAPTYEYDEE
ncbi:MAG: hypothetical protein ACK2UC_14480 [Anaerolineae bacterium]|jgi:type IV secretory pathway TrbD component